MKKTIIALLALGSVAMASTNVQVDGSIELNGTQATDTRLDFKYNSVASQTLTTTVDSVTIFGTDGYGLNTANAVLTMNIQGTLNATDSIKLPYAANASIVVNTTISEAELGALDTDGSAGRWVITADNFGNISSSLLGQIDLNLEGLTGYTDGGMLFDYNGDYYNASDVTLNGIYATVNSGAESVTLADGACYTTLKIAATSSASVKGLGFVVTAPSVPEPTTATLSLLALAGLAARRRRK